MASKLAKLADLKALIGTSETSQDTLLNQLLERASAQAEALVGVTEGGLRRQTDVIEYPVDHPAQTRYVTLRRLPIERVVTVRQLYAAAAPSSFSVADALTEFDEYVVEARTGRLERVNGVWYLEPQCLQVTYTAGWVDPGTSVSTWATATAYAAGALVRGDGSPDALVYCCIQAHTSGSGSEPPNADYWVLVHEVPEALQHGVLQQAIRLWQSRDTAGLRETVTVGGGASISLAEAKPHPALVEACQAWRVYR
jgi:hypothetical protein